LSEAEISPEILDRNTSLPIVRPVRSLPPIRGIPKSRIASRRVGLYLRSRLGYVVLKRKESPRVAYRLTFSFPLLSAVNDTDALLEMKAPHLLQLASCPGLCHAHPFSGSAQTKQRCLPLRHRNPGLRTRIRYACSLKRCVCRCPRRTRTVITIRRSKLMTCSYLKMASHSKSEAFSTCRQRAVVARHW